MRQLLVRIFNIQDLYFTPSPLRHPPSPSFFHRLIPPEPSMHARGDAGQGEARRGASCPHTTQRCPLLIEGLKVFPSRLTWEHGLHLSCLSCPRCPVLSCPLTHSVAHSLARSLNPSTHSIHSTLQKHYYSFLSSSPVKLPALRHHTSHHHAAINSPHSSLITTLITQRHTHHSTPHWTLITSRYSSSTTLSFC